VDLITLADELANRKQLESIGDVAYISSLVDGVPDRPSIKNYIRIVREKAGQRKLIRACNAGIGAIPRAPLLRKL
jgi:replicative DNA helicase